MPEFGFVQRNWRTGASLADISTITYEPEGTHRLCRPAVWTARVNLQDPRAASLVPLSTSLQVTFEGATVFHGFTWRVHRQGDLNKASALVTWIDPSQWWWYRVVRDSTGNFSYPRFPVGATGGRMLRDAIAFSEQWEGLPPSGPPSPMAISIGSDTSIVDLSARPVSFPMKIAELALLLGSTGRCDFWVAPKVTPGRMGDLVVMDRAGHTTGINLVYGEGGNCAAGELIEDAESIATALWYFIGPKEDEEHWLYNVQLDDPGLPSPPQAALEASVHAQRSAIGLWQDMRYFDGADAEDTSDPIVIAERRLLRRMWQLEQAFRMQPKQLMHLSPVDGTVYPWSHFFLGDKVHGSVPGLGSSAAGLQRVYGFKIRPGNETKPEVELLTANTDAP